MASANNLAYQKIKALGSMIDYDFNPKSENEYCQFASLFSIPPSWILDLTVSLRQFKRYISLKYDQSLFPLSKNFDPKLVGKKIFVLRSVHHLSQKQMAYMLNTSEQKIRSIENGIESYQDTLNVCIPVSRILKIDIPLLFDNALSTKDFRTCYLNQIHCPHCTNCSFAF